MPGVAPRGGKSNTRVAGGRRVVDIPSKKTFEANGGGILAPGPFLFPPPGPGAKCDYVLIKYRRGATGGGLTPLGRRRCVVGRQPPTCLPSGIACVHPGLLAWGVVHQQRRRSVAITLQRFPRQKWNRIAPPSPRVGTAGASWEGPLREPGVWRRALSRSPSPGSRAAAWGKGYK